MALYSTYYYNDLVHDLFKTLKVCTGFSTLIIVCSFIVSNSWMNNDMVNALTPHLIGKRPNTYTFTKSLAEHVLLQEADNFPIAIFRPSIIGAAWKEPYEVSTHSSSSNYMYRQVNHFLFVTLFVTFYVYIITGQGRTRSNYTGASKFCSWASENRSSVSR